MLALSINTYFHLMGVITIFICLIYERATLRNRVLTNKDILNLSKADSIYGLAAIVVVVTGLLNWFELGKGYDYYANNSIFVTKFSLFSLVGLLSLYPTIVFAKNKKAVKRQGSEQLELKNAKPLKWVVNFELIIMICLPMLAQFMSNGIDF